MTQLPPLVSDIDAIAWPAIQGGRRAEIMALQAQFDASQWWPAERLRDAQVQQLSALAEHAAKTVPFHAKRLWDAGFRAGRPVDETMWRRLPILTRADLRDLEPKLHAREVPTGFGRLSMAYSSGSTGVPVRVRKSALDGLIWNANSVREERWHCEDVTGTYACIKAFSGVEFEPEHAKAIASPDGLILPNWGPPASLIWKTGRLGLLHSSRSTTEKVEFLCKLQPDYVLTSPSTLRLILGHMREHGLSLQSVRSVRAGSERLEDDLRELCQDVLGCRIVQNYSANEIGYIALQCPETRNFHIVSETVYCEVLDGSGHPCQPGQIGRVVVTPLHNYAMPLLRYEVGDEAEVGEPCPCGRGLPVLKDVVGRLQEYVTLKSGLRRRVTYNTYRLSSVRAIVEYQLVQTSLETIELRLVVRRPLSEAETGIVMEIMTASFGDVFAINLRYCDELPRTAAGKLRPFLSELAPT